MRIHKRSAVATIIGAAVILSWPAASSAQVPASLPPAPRLANGTVNLGRVPGEKGYWNTPYITNMGARVINPETGKLYPLGGGRGGAAAEPFVPFQPWAAAIYNYNTKNESQFDPEGYCLPPGGPRMMATPYPLDILQLPEQERVIMIFEGATHVWREIYTDGRPHPTGDALNPTFLGHSIGHYEDNGATLVVDVVGFNENTWLDYFGHPHTDMLHVVEKFSRPNKTTLHYEASIDDPGAYTKPFTVAWDIPWNGNGEMSEYICQENNRYLLGLKDDLGEPVLKRKDSR